MRDITKEDIDASYSGIQDVLQDLIEKESTLAGGIPTSLSKSAQVLKDLSETKVEFGNPTSELEHLTLDMFNETGIEVSNLIRNQIENKFDFYRVVMPVNLQLKPGIVVDQINCKMYFGPKGDNEPIIVSIFPTNLWVNVLEAGSELNIGINSDLKLTASINSPTTIRNIDIPLQSEGKLDTSLHILGFVKTKKFVYNFGRPVISVTGEGGSDCSWRLEQPELAQNLMIKFIVIFKVPKSITQIHLKAIVTAQPKINWLAGELAQVIDRLKDWFSELLQPEGSRNIRERLPLGTCEEWNIILPK